MKEKRRDEELNLELLPKLESIINKELKYTPLCKALNIPIKNGKSKRIQLENLSTCCELEILENPTRYIIKKVYDKEFLNIIKAEKNKFQLLFDAAIYKAMLDNDGKSLYLSGLDRLELLQQVNDNFGYTFDFKSLIKIGPEYAYMNEMGLIVYRVLNQWCKRRLETMAKSCIILMSDGFRLYKEHQGQYGKYKTHFDVPYNSDIEKECQKIYESVYNNFMPDKMSNGQFYNRAGYNKFNSEIQRAIRENFNNEYCDLKKVIILRFPDKEWIKEKLIKTYAELESFQELNDESIRKIQATKQLNKFTGEERDKFIEVNMSLNPPISFKEELKKLKEKREGN